MASVLNEVAKENKGKAVIGLVMVTERDLVKTFGIRKIPATFVVRNGQITESFVGTAPKEKITRMLL
jgi:thioredoxin-like negative regulator of GroEL